MEAVDPRWRKASYSDNGGNCVEVGDDDGRVLVRDTEDHTGPTLRFTTGAWRRFAGQVKRSLAPERLTPANAVRGYSRAKRGGGAERARQRRQEGGPGRARDTYLPHPNAGGYAAVVSSS